MQQKREKQKLNIGFVLLTLSLSTPVLSWFRTEAAYTSTLQDVSANTPFSLYDCIRR